MKSLNVKIRNEIANSYYLKLLAKDDKITKDKKNELYNSAYEIDKKIIFYKKLNYMLKEQENDTRFNRSNSR